MSLNKWQKLLVPIKNYSKNVGREISLAEGYSIESRLKMPVKLFSTSPLTRIITSDLRARKVFVGHCK